jgi:hypothetical protein
MWTSIVAAILSIIDKLFGIKKSKEDLKVEEFKKKNTDEQIKRAEQIEDIKAKDSAENLVKIINTGNEKQKQEALDQLRIRVSG